jgi:hypothetical protein
MEEKVYSRSVNKTGLGLRVVDGKDMLRNFSAKEVEDLNRVADWVQCDRCEKWRMFPAYANVDAEALPESVSMKLLRANLRYFTFSHTFLGVPIVVLRNEQMG